jgi:hypothetical protein
VLRLLCMRTVTVPTMKYHMHVRQPVTENSKLINLGQPGKSLQRQTPLNNAACTPAPTHRYLRHRPDKADSAKRDQKMHWPSPEQLTPAPNPCSGNSVRVMENIKNRRDSAAQREAVSSAS